MILNEPVEFPDNAYFQTLSSQCKTFVRKLLNKNQKKRLGSRAGASEVKFHPFFNTINFALLRNMKPPIIPSKAQPIRAVHFNRIKESVSFELESTSDHSVDDNDPFGSFSSGK